MTGCSQNLKGLRNFQWTFAIKF